MEKPILVPKELQKVLEQQARARARGFEADYMDGAHDLYVLLTHENLLAKPDSGWIPEAEYWKKRCELAEKYISESPCDPDILPLQIQAYNECQEFIKTETPKQP